MMSFQDLFKNENIIILTISLFTSFISWAYNLKFHYKNNYLLRKWCGDAVGGTIIGFSLAKIVSVIFESLNSGYIYFLALIFSLGWTTVTRILRNFVTEFVEIFITASKSTIIETAKALDTNKKGKRSSDG